MAKRENVPGVREIGVGQTIKLETQYGHLSRGRCWGKCYPGQTRPKGEWRWVAKSGGTLHLDEPGYYIVGSSDGFSREARGEFCLRKKVETVAPEISDAIARVNGEGAIVPPERFDPCL